MQMSCRTVQQRQRNEENANRRGEENPPQRKIPRQNGSEAETAGGNNHQWDRLTLQI